MNVSKSIRAHSFGLVLLLLAWLSTGSLGTVEVARAQNSPSDNAFWVSLSTGTGFIPANPECRGCWDY